MTIHLKSDVSPTNAYDTVEDQMEDGCYRGIPEGYIESTRHGFDLASTIASEIDWTVLDIIEDRVHIRADAQSVSVDGDEISLNPAVWTAWVDAGDVEGDIHAERATV